jgi:hypothetical protein
MVQIIIANDVYSLLNLADAISNGVIRDFKRLGEGAEVLTESIKPLQTISKELSNVPELDQATSNLIKVINMLEAAGASADTSAAPNKTKDFKKSMENVAAGIANFFNKTSTVPETFLDRMASSLERIAKINFGNMFAPFNDFLKHTDEIKDASKALEKMAEALEPKSSTMLNKVAGAFGAVFNGGDRAEIDPAAIQSATENGRNPIVDDAVVSMYGLLLKWDGQGAFSGAGRETTNYNVSVEGGRPRSAIPSGENYSMGG